MAWILTIDVDPAQVSRLTDQLWALGTNGVAEVPRPDANGPRLLAGFETEAEANNARSEVGGEVAPIDPTAWAAPEPTSLDVAGRVITIDAGHSFGHGAHPTTQLCLRALERHITAGCSVLDVGCGSGVLSIAARTLGAGRVQAIDIDPAAIEASQQNAERNGVEVDISATPIGDVSGRFDVVVANVLTAELFPLAADIRRMAGGLVILSGALVDQTHQWDDMFPGAVLVSDSVEGEWSGRVYRAAD